MLNEQRVFLKEDCRDGDLEYRDEPQDCYSVPLRNQRKKYHLASPHAPYNAVSVQAILITLQMLYLHLKR